MTTAVLFFTAPFAGPVTKGVSLPKKFTQYALVGSPGF